MNPEERVQRNQSIYCRITKINPEKFSIDAICKTSALEDKENELKPRRDDYYDYEAEREDKLNNDSERKKAQAKQVKLRFSKKSWKFVYIRSFHFNDIFFFKI